MNVIESREIRYKLKQAFPRYFINSNFEVIIHLGRNTYFSLIGIDTEELLIAQILEWLSREATKSGSVASKKYHFAGINSFTGANFSEEDMDKIYCKLGNSVSHELTLKFIRSGYDMELLCD